ncbi:head-tail adaptor protein [Sphingomonas sp. BK235]|uniref:phage head completion protein n=1 Tax=Sphingomonas sp. BK235 TaxID=2512131 RepID=UPI00104FC49B|nr:head-tail adaptor protein [Sphingomonas sp. BK235]TCP36546.1 head-tail adaptor [Sphingomonas sp. BK235]
MIGLDRGAMDRLLRIEKPVKKSGFTGAGKGTWQEVATVWASVQDALPSRGERLAEGLNVATRPARVRMDWSDAITSAMRLVDVTDGIDGRVMQIITAPARLGRDGLEVMVEDYSEAGNAA